MEIKGKLVYKEYFKFKETGGDSMFIKKENKEGNKKYAYFIISEAALKSKVESFLRLFFDNHIDKTKCPNIKNLVLLDKNNDVMDNNSTLSSGIDFEMKLKIDYKNILILQYSPAHLGEDHEDNYAHSNCNYHYHYVTYDDQMTPVSITENFFSNDSEFVEDIQKPPNL